MPRIVDVEKRRAEIVHATATLIARSGVGAATLREVAAEAGWTTGALTYYFADKRELLLATFEGSLAKRVRIRDESTSSDAYAVLLDALRGALPIDADRRQHWLVTLALCVYAVGDKTFAKAQRDAYLDFRAHVAIHIQQTELADGTEAVALAERLIALVDGIAMQALFAPPEWTPDHQLATFETGLTAIVAGLPAIV